MILKDFIHSYIDTLKNVDVNINDIYNIVSSYYKKDISIFLANFLYQDVSNLDKDNITKMLDMFYIKKIPIQYITNYKYFYNEKYFVNNNSLIPRDDSEILVSVAIDLINKNGYKKCIDMCSR